MLRKTGLVVLERQGRFRLYRTEPSCVLAVAASVEQLVSTLKRSAGHDESAGNRSNPAEERKPDLRDA